MNMSGIEILKQTEIMDIHPNTVALIIVCILSVLAIVCAKTISFYRNKYEESPDIFRWVGVISLSVAIFALLGSFAFPDKRPTGRYEYEVLIDDSVSIKEVYKNYEIVNEKGDIYILRDLVPNEDSYDDYDARINKER